MANEDLNPAVDVQDDNATGGEGQTPKQKPQKKVRPDNVLNREEEDKGDEGIGFEDRKADEEFVDEGRGRSNTFKMHMVRLREDLRDEDVDDDRKDEIREELAELQALQRDVNFPKEKTVLVKLVKVVDVPSAKDKTKTVSKALHMIDCASGKSFSMRVGLNYFNEVENLKTAAVGSFYAVGISKHVAEDPNNPNVKATEYIVQNAEGKWESKPHNVTSDSLDKFEPTDHFVAKAMLDKAIDKAISRSSREEDMEYAERAYDEFIKNEQDDKKREFMFELLNRRLG